MFKASGIRLICSGYAGTNLDVPALPAEMNSVFDDVSGFAVIDLGGDEKGALALGRYAERLKKENDFEMLLVINRYRPLTRDAGALMKIKCEIENAAGILFTGIINNPNLGRETSLKDIESSFCFAAEVSEKLKLPVKMTAVKKELADSISAGNADIFPVGVYGKKEWEI